MLVSRGRFVGTVLSLLGPALGGHALAADDGKRSLEFDGRLRTYIVRTPKNVGQGPLPLIVALHPYPGDGMRMETISGLSAFVDSERLIVAYPDGIDGGFNALMCCGSADDVGFIAAIIKAVESEYPVDQSRIMATGISNGGDMTYRLSAELPGVFTAIAPVSGGMTGGWINKESGNLPRTPVSLLTFYGGRDKYAATFQAGIEYWIARRDCAIKTSTGADAHFQLSAGECRDGSVVRSYRIPDMGHAWPGYAGEGRNAYPDSPVKASDLIVRFLKEGS